MDRHTNMDGWINGRMNRHTNMDGWINGRMNGGWPWVPKCSDCLCGLYPIPYSVRKLCLLIGTMVSSALYCVPRRVNNAGSNAYKYIPLANASDADLINIVETNVLGVMLCCREVCPPSVPLKLGSYADNRGLND